MPDVMEVLPEFVGGCADGLVVRRWKGLDAEALALAIAENAEHLRPWMPWMAGPPLSVAQRRELLLEWEANWARGGDALFGVFLDGEVAGSCGLHRRIARDGLELGYWIGERFTRRGLATVVAARLTDVAFSLPSITHVEIHNDKANVASAGIPRKLHSALVEERTDVVSAPGEIGIELRWRLGRASWEWFREGASTERPGRRSDRDARAG